MKTIPWLIVGGGIHGVHVAVRLLTEGGVNHDELRIVDPEESLLARWRQRTESTGMQFLRSPSVHHLDPEAFALLKFAGTRRKNRKRWSELFTAPYDRPSLKLFNDHCRHLVSKNRLESCHTRGTALSINPKEDGVFVHTSAGDAWQAERVILALGVDAATGVVDWAPENDPRVRHLFALDSTASHQTHHVTVIGGGISAVQAALKEVALGRRVTLISRHQLNKHQFDSDPGWLGPKYMRAFEKERSMTRRRAMIGRARHVGSIPPELFGELKQAEQSGSLDFRVDNVNALSNKGKLSLSLDSGDTLETDRVLLATGLSRHRPGGKLVDQLIDDAALPCADCGYPIVDHDLRWHPRIFVTGALAELELGPAARNISGARKAGDRISSFTKRHLNAHRVENDLSTITTPQFSG